MAFTRPYDVGPYGTGPYSRYAAQAVIPCVNKPYGRGSYGRGLYGGFPGDCNLLEVRAAAGVTFGATASPQTLMVLHAASEIVFDARAIGLQRTIGAAAATQISFDATARLRLSWEALAPFETGGWQPVACETGGWQSASGGGAGTWTEVKLT